MYKRQTPTATPSPRALVQAPARNISPVQAPSTSNNLSSSAGRIKLNRGTSFAQDAAPTPAPTPEAGSSEAKAAKAAKDAEPKSGITPEREKAYRDRAAAIRRQTEDASAALGSALRAAPDCILTQSYSRAFGYSSFTDCTARDGALLPYKTAVAAAAAEAGRLRSDCRNDAWCMPYWVE